MGVTGFGLRVQVVCVFLLICYGMLEGATVVSVRVAVALSEGDIAGSEVAYSVVSVLARLSFARVEESSARCCVTVLDVLSVVVVGTVVTWKRRDVGVTLACSAANCIRVYVNKKRKLQSKRNKQVVLSYKNVEITASDYARNGECNFVVSLTKVLEGDLPDLDEPVV